MKTHIRDDENKQYMDTQYPLTYCGNWVVPEEVGVKYSAPPENVITRRTAENRLKKNQDDDLCKRCVRSVSK